MFQKGLGLTDDAEKVFPTQIYLELPCSRPDLQLITKSYAKKGIVLGAAVAAGMAYAGAMLFRDLVLGAT